MFELCWIFFFVLKKSARAEDAEIVYVSQGTFSDHANDWQSLDGAGFTAAMSTFNGHFMVWIFKIWDTGDQVMGTPVVKSFRCYATKLQLRQSSMGLNEVLRCNMVTKLCHSLALVRLQPAATFHSVWKKELDTQTSRQSDAGYVLRGFANQLVAVRHWVGDMFV